MRKWINLFENQLLPEIVYHGTNLRVWNEQAYHDEPLYLTNDRVEAERHAERTYVAHHDNEDPEYKDPNIVPIVVKFRISDLLDAGLNFEPDWGWDMADENTTWQQSLAAVGSFCIEGFSQSHKALGKVSAAFPETFPIDM